MFCGSSTILEDDGDDDCSTITQSGLAGLLTACYRVAMSNYGGALPAQTSSEGQYTCPYVSLVVS